MYVVECSKGEERTDGDGGHNVFDDGATINYYMTANKIVCGTIPSPKSSHPPHYCHSSLTTSSHHITRTLSTAGPWTRSNDRIHGQR